MKKWLSERPWIFALLAVAGCFWFTIWLDSHLQQSPMEFNPSCVLAEHELQQIVSGEKQ